MGIRRQHSGDDGQCGQGVSGGTSLSLSVTEVERKQIRPVASQIYQQRGHVARSYTITWDTQTPKG